MTMTPRLRKVILTAHITTSVAWLGAVVAYLALDITAVTSRDIQLVRGAFLAMEVTVWSVIVPLALASVLIGVVNALGTQWGLFRHYWVLVKLVLALCATTVLLIETQTINSMADVAGSGADSRELPGSLPHSIGGLIVLVTTTILSVYKPRGLTRYGWRKQHPREQGEQRPAGVASST